MADETAGVGVAVVTRSLVVETTGGAGMSETVETTVLVIGLGRISV